MTGQVGDEAAENAALRQNDYVSPGLKVAAVDEAFPYLIVGDTSSIKWPWLRRWVAHNWYTDQRNPHVGFASRDEAAILYNSALLFTGKPCLEIGCWRGWSAVHLALGSRSLDVIDPVLADPDFAESVRGSCEAAGVSDAVTLHVGSSPEAVDELAGKTGKKWSLIFIDGDHEGDAPRLDAQAAIRHAADTAMVLFHDLASPHVANGLKAMRDAGWRTMVYQTMQIMGVAWRGDVEPVAHIPDPNVFWTLPAHLSSYEVSGWTPRSAFAGREWWPNMSMEDRRDSAMRRAQSVEDELTQAIIDADAASERSTSLATELETVTAARDEASAKLSLAEDDLAAAKAEKATLLAQLRVAEERVSGLAAENRHRVEYLNASSNFARWMVRKRILFGLLRRSLPRRMAALEAQATAYGINLQSTPSIALALCNPRMLAGLFRRRSFDGQALVTCLMLQALRSSTNVPHISRAYDPARENVILVVHETSRTGAPILGWNIGRVLARKYNVFTIYLGDGALTPEFHALSVEAYGPFPREVRDVATLMQALQPLFKSRTFKYAIVNSVESRCILDVCKIHRVPTLFLVHEFGTYVYPASSLRDAFDCATEIVFPAHMVAKSSEVVHPPLKTRNYKVLQQGMSSLPTGNAPSVPPPTKKIEGLAQLKEAGALLVIGAGTVDLRKGVDLFLATAAAVHRQYGDLPIHFVWVGHGYRPTEDMGYSIYLKEQIQRSELESSVTFLGEVSELEPIYELADVFLLTSRLDPLPNVSIDAACRGIPIVCFQDASGTAELLLADPLTSVGVVPYLDADAAARAIADFAEHPEKRDEVAKATSALARELFDMDEYVKKLDETALSLSATASSRPAQAAQ